MNVNPVILLMMVMFSFCSSKTYTQKEENAAGKNIQLADPTIFYHKGTYYLYGTGGNEYSNGFPVYTSANLKTWKGPTGTNNGYALKKGDAFGSAKFWAPQVFEFKNKYYMAYAASEHIGIAESDNPLGPFTSKKITPISEETRQIDPYILIDNDGKKYMYYVAVANGANRIYVVEMNDDFSSLKKETARLCIEATDHWENTENEAWSVTEGPTVIKHNNLYYLIYSANHFKSVDYAVGYAVSNSPIGPWKKYEGNPIIHRSITGKTGSGHGDLFKAANGDWYYVFHTHYDEKNITPRKTGLIRMDFVKDGNKIDKLVVHPNTFRYLKY